VQKSVTVKITSPRTLANECRPPFVRGVVTIYLLKYRTFFPKTHPTAKFTSQSQNAVYTKKHSPTSYTMFTLANMSAWISDQHVADINFCRRRFGPTSRCQLLWFFKRACHTHWHANRRFLSADMLRTEIFVRLTHRSEVVADKSASVNHPLPMHYTTAAPGWLIAECWSTQWLKLYVPDFWRKLVSKIALHTEMHESFFSVSWS